MNEKNCSLLINAINNPSFMCLRNIRTNADSDTNADNDTNANPNTN